MFSWVPLTSRERETEIDRYTEQKREREGNKEMIKLIIAILENLLYVFVSKCGSFLDELLF